MNLNNAFILVTGGCGFIGSNFIRYLLLRHPGVIIANFDLGPQGHYAASGNNLAGISNIPHYYHDISSSALGSVIDVLRRKYNEKDFVIFHFAAESHVTRSEFNPEIFKKTNFGGTKNLFKSLIKSSHACQTKSNTLVHVSSDEVYGPAEKNVFFKENDRRPGTKMATSNYAVSKEKADDFIFRRSKKTDIRTMIVRPTNNFGPYQFPEKYLPRCTTRLLMGFDAIIWAQGQQIRDWLFVEDTCKAICLVAEKGQAGEVYNIGVNHNPEISNAEMAKKIVKLLDLPESRLKFIPDPRPQHDERYAVDIQKIRSLGWEPRNFEDQIKTTVEWYEKNQAWWMPLINEAESIYGKEKK
jgi:dTDP-glucose 4,6-dehydratase